jgi:hypothetical protein
LPMNNTHYPKYFPSLSLPTTEIIYFSARYNDYFHPPRCTYQRLSKLARRQLNRSASSSYVTHAMQEYRIHMYYTWMLANSYGRYTHIYGTVEHDSCIQPDAYDSCIWSDTYMHILYIRPGAYMYTETRCHVTHRFARIHCVIPTCFGYG